MYIAPTTNIRLLSGVPLDGKYENTVLFASASAQQTYFISKTKYNLAGYTFQRVTKGVARVGLPVNNLYDVNYMMFQNTGFGNRWFYAFVTNVEYINNTVTEIRYELDVMQTWLFDYTLEQCFVERAHGSTDAIGDNILPEPLELGEYVYNTYSRLISTPDTDELEKAAFILAINDLSGASASAGKYDGVPSGSVLWAFAEDDIAGIEAKITEYIQKPDAITALYTVPWRLLGMASGHPSSGGEQLTSPKSAANFLKELPAAHRVTNTTSLNGYTPKNKKLLTYPFNFLEVITGTGNALNLRYEFFSGTPSFRIGGTITQPVAVYLKPASYKGAGSTPSLSMADEQLSLSGYPMGSWINDAYEAWVAQNSVPMTLGFVSQIASGAVSGAASGGLVGALAGAGISALGGITDIMMQDYKASIAADQQHGNPSSANVNFSASTLDFFVGRRSINAQMARSIDDYFTMFGYAQRKVMIPNRSARPRWTYIKTIGCQGKGSIPNSDAVQIDSIYDNGIRFWKSAADIGDYTLNNAPA